MQQVLNDPPLLRLEFEEISSRFENLKLLVEFRGVKTIRVC